MSVLIDKQGVIRWVDKGVDVKTHGEDVVAKLAELGMAPAGTKPANPANDQ